MDASEKKAIFMMNVSNELKVSEINFRSKAIYKNDSAFVKIRAYNFNT